MACVFGCAGPVLTVEEAAFFRDVQPWGFILFDRNIETPDQVRRLVAALRASVDCPGAAVMIDQEGGRVQRLGPPFWPAYPSARTLGGLSLDLDGRRDCVRLGARLIAADLAALGINVCCAPVLDVPGEDAHPVIGDRAYGAGAGEVGALARAAAEGFLAGGVLPVMKHVPGHGRARSDSHRRLPVVTESRAELDAVDFSPFRALSDMPIAMTAHVVYAAIDPLRPATCSRTVVSEVIRGAIGFQGLLITDDLSMKALSGDLATRAGAALDAGCDVVLHCGGDATEMRAVAAGARPLAGRGAGRAAAALARLPNVVEPFDRPGAAARFAVALAAGGVS